MKSPTLETVASKVNALKAQLRFRQYVLRQDAGSTPAGKNIYSYSRIGAAGTRVQKTWQELADNVKLLVVHACRKDDEGASVKSVLIGRRVRHRFRRAGDGSDTWYQGKVISQVRTRHDKIMGAHRRSQHSICNLGYNLIY